MKKLWCSIWRAFLNAFDDAVDHIAYAIDTLTPPVLNLLSGVGDVAGDVIKDAGSAINGVFGGSRLLLGGILVGAYFLLTSGKEEKSDLFTSNTRIMARSNVETLNSNSGSV